MSITTVKPHKALANATEKAMTMAVVLTREWVVDRASDPDGMLDSGVAEGATIDGCNEGGGK